jgi:hypothetical protein
MARRQTMCIIVTPTWNMKSILETLVRCALLLSGNVHQTSVWADVFSFGEP